MSDILKIGKYEFNSRLIVEVVNTKIFKQQRCNFKQGSEVNYSCY